MSQAKGVQILFAESYYELCVDSIKLARQNNFNPDAIFLSTCLSSRYAEIRDELGVDIKYDPIRMGKYDGLMTRISLRFDSVYEYYLRKIESSAWTSSK